MEWKYIIEQLLDSHFMTQVELAELCKVSQQAVSFWVKGQYKPSKHAQKQLTILAHKFDIKKSNPLEILENSTEYGEDDFEIKSIYSSLSEEKQQRLLEFAKFLQSSTS